MRSTRRGGVSTRCASRTWTTGELLDDVLEHVTGNLAWANDNATLFYGKQDPDTLRAFQVFRHQLGHDPSSDVLVFEEADETFSTTVFKTKSKQYLMIASHQTVSTEYRYLSADDPGGEFLVFLPRERFHEYDVDHEQGRVLYSDQLAGEELPSHEDAASANGPVVVAGGPSLS